MFKLHKAQPQEVTAIRWDGTFKSAQRIIEWFLTCIEEPEDTTLRLEESCRFIQNFEGGKPIPTLEMDGGVIRKNQWIVRAENNAFSIVDHDKFQELYTITGEDNG